ncbi:hypothetical protein ABK040_010324 [Willaertia magna]
MIIKNNINSGSNETIKKTNNNNNPYVFHHSEKLWHLSEAEKEAIVADMQKNWKEHFPTRSSYVKKMNQLYNLRKVNEFLKAFRIMKLEEEHFFDYPYGKQLFYLFLLITIIGLPINVYITEMKAREPVLEFEKKFGKEGYESLKSIAFEISEDDARERLALMEQKKQIQAGSEKVQPVVDEKFKLLGCARLFPNKDYNGIVKQQEERDEQMKKEKVIKDIPTFVFSYEDPDTTTDK